MAFQQKRKVIPVVYVIVVDSILYSAHPLLCTRFVGRTGFFEMSVPGSDFGRMFPPQVPSLKAVVLLASDAGLGEESPHVSAGGAATILTQGPCVCVRTRVYVGNRMTHSSWNLFSLSESHHPQKSSPPFFLN